MSKVRKILPVLLSASVMAAAVMPVLTLSAAGSGIQDGYSWTMEDGGFYSGDSRFVRVRARRETISPPCGWQGDRPVRRAGDPHAL